MAEPLAAQHPMSAPHMAERVYRSIPEPTAASMVVKRRINFAEHAVSVPGKVWWERETRNGTWLGEEEKL